jgi:O-antigen ligase/Flp pilus assembly protein TadD
MNTQLEKILKYIALGSIFVLPILPFIVSSSLFFPFITGKNFFFRIVVEVGFFAWAVLALLDARYRPRFSWIFGALAGLVVFVTFADFVAAPSFFKAFWSNFERMEGLVTILHLLAYFVVVASMCKTEKIVDWLLRTTIGASVIVGFYGLFQLAGFITINQGGVRLDATFGNATYLAVYMLVHLFLTAWMLYRDKEIGALRFIYGGVALLQFIVLYHTATRGAILGFLGGVTLTALIFLVRGKKTNPRIFKYSLGLLGVFVLLGAGFFTLRATGTLPEGGPLARLGSISLTERTVESRFLIWQTAWEGAQERPVFGWGHEGYMYVFSEHYNPEMWKQEPWFDRAHNVFLDWLIVGGFPGLLLYLLLFAIALWYVWKSEAFEFVEQALLTGLLAGYFFNNLFVFDNIVSYWLFITLLALVHSRFISKKILDENVDVIATVENQMKQNVVLAIATIACIATVYVINVPALSAAHATLQALIPQEEGLAKNLELYQNAYDQNTVGQQEVAEQLSGFAQRVVGLDVPDEMKEAYVTRARVLLESEIEKNPRNPRPPFFLGGFLTRIGQPTEALPVLEQARLLGPNRQITLFEIARAYQGVGNIKEALLSARQAYELAPEFDQAATLYAGLLYRDGQSDTADALLENVSLSAQADSGELISALAEASHFSQLIALWEERVQRDPNDANARLSLAASYMTLNEREKAVAQIQVVIDQNPEFKEQGEYYIAEIRAGRNP